MSAVHEILLEYTRMRESSLDSKSTLQALRPYIESLSDQFKAELAKNIRLWESGDLKLEKEPKSPISEITRQDLLVISDITDEISNQLDPVKPPPVQPIARQLAATDHEPAPTSGLKPGTEWVACPNCSTKNKANEFFCYACGQLMDAGGGVNVTRNFVTASQEAYTPEFFGKDSLLILRMRDSGAFFKLRPQSYTHELVIGRSSTNTAMTPDIDLAEEKADEFGVSRLHFAIQYVLENSALLVFDLGSANGSFINGQKLHPSEKRVLRNGDELRLGRLVIRTEYEHPGTELE